LAVDLGVKPAQIKARTEALHDIHEAHGPSAALRFISDKDGSGHVSLSRSLRKNRRSGGDGRSGTRSLAGVSR
jgi:hypothetical protein